MAYSESRTKRHRRVRAKVSGTAERPRLAVFRSNTSVYAQLIDDVARQTIASATVKDLKASKISKSEQAKLIGEAIAKKAQDKKISAVVFDRGGYQYHGRVKALADAAREAGLTF